jgi:hypothetical protein
MPCENGQEIKQMTAITKADDTAKEVTAAEELTVAELDHVAGGSFELGNIVGSVAKAVLPMVID